MTRDAASRKYIGLVAVGIVIAIVAVIQLLATDLDDAAYGGITGGVLVAGIGLFMELRRRKRMG